MRWLIWGQVLLLSTIPVSTVNGQQDFDDIDKMLEQQFQDTDAQLEEQFKMVEEAVDRAFKGLTRKIEVRWRKDTKVPSKSEWVTYTKDLSTRTIINFEKGEVTIEKVIPNDMPSKEDVQAVSDVMAETLTMSESDMEDSDIFLQAINEEIAKTGIEDDSFESMDLGEDLSMQELIPDADKLVAQILNFPDKDLVPTLASDLANQPATTDVQESEELLRDTAEEERKIAQESSTSTRLTSSATEAPAESTVAELTATETTTSKSTSTKSTTVAVENKPSQSDAINTNDSEKTLVAAEETVTDSQITGSATPGSDESVKPEETISREQTESADKTKEVHGGASKAPIVSELASVEQRDNPSSTNTDVKPEKAQVTPNVLSSKQTTAEAVEVAKAENKTEQQPQNNENNGQQQASKLTTSGTTVLAATKTATEAEPEVKFVKENGVAKLQINIKFVNHFQKVLIQKNMGAIEAFSDEYQVPISTILAIIETESSFNPRATSPIPAFGLMQLVPRTAGVDAFYKVYGEKKVVSPEYLYDEENNLELGTAYFNVLMRQYLRRVENPMSRFYCAVASYNTGIGNVSRTFSGSKRIRDALPVINSMTEDEVLNFLLENLPATETKNYLRKIIRYRKKYEMFDA